MVKNPALAIPSRQRKPVMKAILLRLLWTTEREADGREVRALMGPLII